MEKTHYLCGSLKVILMEWSLMRMLTLGFVQKVESAILVCYVNLEWISFLKWRVIINCLWIGLIIYEIKENSVVIFSFSSIMKV